MPTLPSFRIHRPLATSLAASTKEYWCRLHWHVPRCEKLRTAAAIALGLVTRYLFVALVLISVSDSVVQRVHGQVTDSVSSDHKPTLVDSRHLPNLLHVAPGVYSGGLPEGALAFQELAELGIKTIISVDGMKPDVATAKLFNLPYVHLPHGYDGVPEARGKELAKAILELPRPIYIHCHHGKHRSPAASAVGCVIAGLLQPADAEGLLRLAGTSPHYRGLFLTARSARTLDRTELSNMQVTFMEVAPIPPMAEAMVQIEKHFHHMEILKQSCWQAAATHPDLVPAQEVLLLREIYTELLRTDPWAQSDPGFRKHLAVGEMHLREMEKILKKNISVQDSDLLENLNSRLQAVQTNCRDCHHEFRDQPKGSGQVPGR